MATPALFGAPTADLRLIPPKGPASAFGPDELRTAVGVKKRLVGASPLLMNVDSVGRTGDIALELRLRDLIPRGYRLACGMLHDPGRAEDAVQEAALRAWRKRSQLRSGADPQAWFLAIVANECRSARRRRWLSILSLDHRDAPSPAGDDEVLRGADLRRALLALPDKDRLVVVLYFYLDLPLDEVARAARLSTAAARGRLYRSIKKLRPGLELQEGL